MPSLMQRLPLPQRRGEIVTACSRLLDAEVARKGGLGGLAVKAAYKVFKTFKPGVVPEAIDGLLDDFVQALEPLHAEQQAAADGGFGAFLKAHDGQAAEALLGVTDARAAHSRHTTLVKGYRKLRPAALHHVQQAIPGLAELFERFLA